MITSSMTPAPRKVGLYRVEIPVKLTFTVTAPLTATKEDVRVRVQHALRGMFGDEGQRRVLDGGMVTQAEAGLEAALYAAHKGEKTPDGEAIYILKGLELLHRQEGEVGMTAWEKERF